MKTKQEIGKKEQENHDIVVLKKNADRI